MAVSETNDVQPKYKRHAGGPGFVFSTGRDDDWTTAPLIENDGSNNLTISAPLAFAAGLSSFLDVSAAATGEADIVIGDNLASALQVREAGNAYLTFVTTDASEAIQFAQPLTSAAGLSAVLDLSAAATGESDVILGDNLASAFEIREAANLYTTYVTTNGAELVSHAVDQQRAAGARDLSHHLKAEVFDDMFGRANTEAENNPQWILNSGTDAQAIDAAIDTSQAGGVFQLVTGDLDGTTAADGSGMVWSGVPVQLDSTGGVTVVEARIRIKSGITFASLGFGLTDATGLEEPFTNSADTVTPVADDAVGFLYDTDATTDEWFGCAVDSTTLDTGTATTSVAPVADTWQILRIEISADGATISFFIDNAATADLALTGAAGVGPDVVLYPYVIANTTAGTPTSRTVDVDYVRVETVR